VEAHGGQIRVQSQLGQGSRFIVELPLEPPLVLTGPATGASAPPPGDGDVSGSDSSRLAADSAS
jgi:hypothetical protein